MSTSKNHYLRHTLATIAYRFQSSVHEAGDDFGNFDPGHGARTPCEIITHMTHLLRGSASIIKEKIFSSDTLEPLDFEGEIERFNKQLHELDNLFIDTDLTEKTANRLLQGPIADILTHIGQLALMRRLNGNPTGISGFSSAPISVGEFSYFKNG